MRSIRLTPLLLALLAAGCATQAQREAAYDKSLAPWQGQTEDALRARWGAPASVEDAGAGSGKWLTYVVNNYAGAAGGGSTIGFGIGGFGGGHVGFGGGVGITAPLNGNGGGGGGGQPTITCTTRFLVEGGKVSSWTYDGKGCGAG